MSSALARIANGSMMRPHIGASPSSRRCCNEAATRRGLVDDLAAQDFDGEVEMFVADGASDDGSRGAAAPTPPTQAGLALTVCRNPRRIVSTGLNECIGRARGELIVRLDCHSRYPTDYLSRCAGAADETGAWNVGGIYEPVGRTPTERAVACALDGAVRRRQLDARRRCGERVEVDTVYLGAFRPVAFERAGLYSRGARPQPGRRAQPPHPSRGRDASCSTRPSGRDYTPAGRIRVLGRAVLPVRRLEDRGDGGAPAGAQRPLAGAAGARRLAHARSPRRHRSPGRPAAPRGRGRDLPARCGRVRRPPRCGADASR